MNKDHNQKLEQLKLRLAEVQAEADMLEAKQHALKILANGGCIISHLGS